MNISNNLNAKLSILFLIIWQCIFCQEKYYSEWYSADSNHLPQNSVKSIVPDKYGFLWIATENGIVRYNGLNFKTFSSENVAGIHSNRMMLFSGDISKDSIVIFNEKEETLLIKGRTVQKCRYKLSYPDRDLQKTRRDSYILYPYFRYTLKDKPFVAGGKNTSYILRNDSILSYNIQSGREHHIKYTYKDSSQFFVITDKLYQFAANGYIRCGETASTEKFNHPLLADTRIYRNELAGQVFAWSGNKLFQIKDKKGSLILKLIYEGSDYESDNIISLYYDEADEILFLGSTNKGLMIVKRQSFRHNETDYRHASGTDDVYYAVEKFANNSILASTGEIFHEDGSTALIGTGSYTDKYLLVIDDKGNIWTKDGAKLYRFRKQKRFKNPDTWELTNSITTIAKKGDGKLIIGAFGVKGSFGGYLFEINTKDAFPTPKLLFKTPMAISVIRAIDRNTLLAGSWTGLHKIHLNNRNIERVNGISNTLVRNIYMPNSTEAWIGTYEKGFYLLKDGKVTRFPLDSNRYLLTVHCIVEDKEGFLWITTNKGLFTAKKQDLYNYANGKTSHVYYHLYIKQSGFSNNEFNGGCDPCGVYLNNNTMFLPSMDGVVYFNPSKTKKRQPLSGIYLDDIMIDEAHTPVSDTLVFNRNFGRIQFYFASPYFGNPSNQNLETCLEGPVSQKWTPMTENYVSFSTLPPGDYILKTRKLGGFGSKHIYKDFRFTIPRAFWQTAWFSGVLLFIILAGLFLAYWLRIRYMQSKTRHLEKHVLIKTQQLQNTVAALRKTKDDLTKQVAKHKGLIKTITHDIKSPLRFMAITGKHLYNDFENAEDSHKESIKAIYSSSSQLYNFVDNFLEYAKETNLEGYDSEPYCLYELVNEKISFFRHIAADAGTVIINNTHKKAIVPNRQLLSIILHNLLDNALKHTTEGIIIIESLFTKKSFSISVKDSGTGMDRESLTYYHDLLEGKTEPLRKNGMGLHMIIELLAVMEGTMAITDKENGYTTFTITFKCKS